MFWLLDSTEKENICVALRRMLFLHTFKLLCFCVEEFLDALLVKVKLGLLVFMSLDLKSFLITCLTDTSLAMERSRLCREGNCSFSPILDILGRLWWVGNCLGFFSFIFDSSTDFFCEPDMRGRRRRVTMKICIFLMFQQRKLGWKWREMGGGGDISGREGGGRALFRGNQNMNSV